MPQSFRAIGMELRGTRPFESNVQARGICVYGQQLRLPHSSWYGVA
jgi:hypothetical protein